MTMGGQKAPKDNDKPKQSLATCETDPNKAPEKVEKPPLQEETKGVDQQPPLPFNKLCFWTCQPAETLKSNAKELGLNATAPKDVLAMTLASFYANKHGVQVDTESKTWVASANPELRETAAATKKSRSRSRTNTIQDSQKPTPQPEKDERPSEDSLEDAIKPCLGLKGEDLVSFKKRMLDNGITCAAQWDEWLATVSSCGMSQRELLLFFAEHG